MSQGSSKRYLALIVLSIVLVLLVGLTLGVSPPRNQIPETSTGSASSGTVLPSKSFDESFADHMTWLSSRNISILVAQYEKNATVLWVGTTNGLAGNYTGQDLIRTLLNDSFAGPLTISLTISNVTETANRNPDGSASVNSSFAFVGQNKILGNFSGLVRAEDTFVYSHAEASWLISRETWNFVSFDVQFPYRFFACQGPECPESVRSMALSQDNNYLAAGTYENTGYGHVFFVSLNTRTALWKAATDTVVWSVSISSNGSLVAAAGFSRPGDPHGPGRVYLFDGWTGALLWNVSAGSKPRAVEVAISSDGSRVAAYYGSGILYLDSHGRVLWNYSFPEGGISSSFTMSASASVIVYANQNITAGGGHRWGVFALDTQGHQMWAYEGGRIGSEWHYALVKMSRDGSRVAALAQNFYNGTIIYFDGGTGAVGWERPYYLRPAVADYASLAMSPDGSFVAGGCPASGIMIFDSSGKSVSGEADTRAFGEPVLVLEGVSSIVTQNLVNGQIDLLKFNGTLIASPRFDYGVTALADSPDGSEWIAAEGLITKSGTCSSLQSYEGPTNIWTLNLCR